MRVLIVLLALAACVSAAPRFEIKQAKTAGKTEFYFNLVGGNNEVVLTSEMYPNAKSAQKGVVAVMAVGTDKANYHQETAKSTPTKPYWTLKADNNEIIGVSEMFEGKQPGRSIESTRTIIETLDNEIAAKIKSKDAVIGADAPCKIEFIEENKKFRFRLVAKNNEIVAVSEVYNDEAGAVNGISSVLRNCGARKNIETKTSKDKLPFVHCKAQNNQILINTETYKKAKTAEEATTLVYGTVRKYLSNYAKAIKVAK